MQLPVEGAPVRPLQQQADQVIAGVAVMIGAGWAKGPLMIPGEVDQVSGLHHLIRLFQHDLQIVFAVLPLVPGDVRNA